MKIQRVKGQLYSDSCVHWQRFSSVFNQSCCNRTSQLHFLCFPSPTGFTVILESVLLILQMSRLTLALIEFALFLQWNRQSCCVSIILCSLYCLCCLFWKAPQTLTSYKNFSSDWCSDVFLACCLPVEFTCGTGSQTLFSQLSLHVLPLFRFWIYS